MKLQFHSSTDIGQKRNTNQDRFIQNNQSKLFAVADGMGGHVGGEVASQMAVDTLNKFFSISSGSIDPISFLIKALEQANLNIYNESLRTPSLKGMGTTLTALHFSYDTANIAHVGDSRIYLIREDMIWQLSEDHTLVVEQKIGNSYPLRNVITRSVGYERETKIDTYTKKIDTADLYLLCTDGLYNFVKNREIAHTISSSSSLEKGVKKLIDLANSRKADDNITVVAVKVVDTF